MRGIRLIDRMTVWRVGITPAHAGNTQPYHYNKRPEQDHPRACGEYPRRLNSRPRRRGSPPRMRGILGRVSFDSACYGITPAHAGNTFILPIAAAACWDHPRACGEYGFLPSSLTISGGSPPRMRGIPMGLILIAGMVRITPAHAGNTFGYQERYAEYRDHPRACGEYVVFDFAKVYKEGSPPRMRGIRLA